jgi:hypothetical protein
MDSQSSKLRGSMPRIYRGISFTLWNRRHSWFWSVFYRSGDFGVIGTAATESEAISEACLSIDELLLQRGSLSMSPGLNDTSALAPKLTRAYPCNVSFWMDWWMSVAHQVTGRMLNRWADLILRSS